MKIEYIITKRDFEKGNKYLQKHSNVGKLQRKIGFFIIFIIAAFYTIQKYNGNIFASVFFFLFLLLFAYLFNKLFLFVSNKILFGKLCKPENSRGILGRHEIELTEDALIESTEFNLSHHKWVTIEKISETEEYLFILITGVGAHYIPKKHFNSPVHCNEFYKELKKYSRKVIEI